MKLSVIVPVFNQSAYLNECLESIMVQSVDSMEVLLIDDGSTDGSGDICDTWADRDSRIRVFHTKNHGLSSARNLGLDKAIGEYFAFVDSDDVLHPEMYSTMLEAMSVLDVDIVECDYREFIDGELDHSKEYTRIFQIRRGSDLASRHVVRHVVVWNKVYRSWIWENLRFPIGRIHEDDYLYFRWLSIASKVLVIGEPYYLYRQTPLSLSRRPFTTDRLDLVAAREDQVRFYEECGRHELARRAKTHWYRTVSEGIRLCLLHGYKKEARVLRMGLIQHIGWILSNGCSVYRRLVMMLNIPSIGRSISLFAGLKEIKGCLFRFAHRLSLRYARPHRSSIPTIYSFGEPTHGNLGDHAIVLGQYIVLSRAFPRYRLVPVCDAELKEFMERRASYVTEDDLIVLAGGGNWGTLYPHEEEMRLRVLRRFPTNRIFMFPQSVHISGKDDDWKPQIYRDHRHIRLSFRDPISRNRLEKRLPCKPVELLPDAALFLSLPHLPERNMGIMLCLRNDVHGTIGTREKLKVLSWLQNQYLPYTISDTHLERTVSPSMRRSE
jgi:glycosyltransferase involved in cell wall biosynthesis